MPDEESKEEAAVELAGLVMVTPFDVTVVVGAITRDPI